MLKKSIKIILIFIVLASVFLFNLGDAEARCLQGDPVADPSRVGWDIPLTKETMSEMTIQEIGRNITRDLCPSPSSQLWYYEVVNEFVFIETQESSGEWIKDNEVWKIRVSWTIPEDKGYSGSVGPNADPSHLPRPAGTFLDKLDIIKFRIYRYKQTTLKGQFILNGSIDINYNQINASMEYYDSEVDKLYNYKYTITPIYRRKGVLVSVWKGDLSEFGCFIRYPNINIETSGSNTYCPDEFNFKKDAFFSYWSGFINSSGLHKVDSDDRSLLYAEGHSWCGTQYGICTAGGGHCKAGDVEFDSWDGHTAFNIRNYDCGGPARLKWFYFTGSPPKYLPVPLDAFWIDKEEREGIGLIEDIEKIKSCNLISASISADNCPVEGCDVGNVTTLSATFDGSGCPSINKLVFSLTNGNIDLPMTVDCPFDENTYSCSGDFELPVCYDGQVFWIKNASAYVNTSLVAYNDTELLGIEEFTFTTYCSKLIALDLLPDFREVIVNQWIYLTVNAFFEKNGVIRKEDVTTSPYTKYISSNPSVFYVDQGVARAFGEGLENITTTYPHDFSGKLSDTSTFRAWPNVNCLLEETKIISYCGDVCNMGDKITMVTKPYGYCNDYLSGGGKITMIAENITSYDERCIVNMTGTLYPCEVGCICANWTIPDNMDWENCGGKTVYIKNVGLWNKTGNEYSLIGSLDVSQVPSRDDFGSFTFWKPNFPPTIQMQITGTPVIIDETPIPDIFNITKDVYLNQTSFDPNEDEGDYIIFWGWYFRESGDSEWITIHETGNENESNKIYNFESYKSGVYEINLTLIDTYGATSSEIEEIKLWNGEDPLAIISSPALGEVFEPSTNILFNGSRSSALGSPETWYLNWTWFNGISWEVLEEGTYNDIKEFNRTFVNPSQEYKVNLTITDAAASDTSQRIFNIARCVKGNVVIFPGRCFSGTMEYCERSDEEGGGTRIISQDCRYEGCSCSPKICDQSSGDCVGVPEPDECKLENNYGTCHGVAGCYWSNGDEGECLACYQNNKPQSCSDYSEKACAVDNCGMARIGLGSEDCGKVITQNGIQYYVDNCHCSWHSEAFGCQLNQTLTEDGTGEQKDCAYSIEYSECGGGGCEINERNVTYDLADGSDIGCPKPEPECQTCALLLRPMPFFSWFNVIAVIALLAILYIFIFKIKKQRK